MGKWWVVLLFLSFILSCEKDTKNRNNYAPVLSEAKKDSLFLSDAFFWICFNRKMNISVYDSLLNLKNNEIVKHRLNNIYYCEYLEKDSIIFHNTSVRLISGDWVNTPIFFFKTKVGDEVYRNILVTKWSIEDSLALKGEIRLYELENFINENYLLKKNVNLHTYLDKLILLYTAQTNRIMNRTAADFFSTLKCENIVKYDTSFLKSQPANIDTITKRMLELFPKKTVFNWHTPYECPAAKYRRSKYFKDRMLEEDNVEFEKIKKESYNYFKDGYRDCLQNFTKTYNLHYKNDKNTSIYFSIPEMKFYFIRIDKSNGLKIFYRIINSDRYPNEIYEEFYSRPKM